MPDFPLALPRISLKTSRSLHRQELFSKYQVRILAGGSSEPVLIGAATMASRCLSNRGTAAAHPNKGMLMWDVIQDLWHEQDNPNGYVSLGLAENSLMHDELVKHIHDHISLPTSALTYGDGPPAGSRRLRTAMAKFLTKHLKPVRRIEANHVFITNGCSSAVEHLSWALANPGDGFLLGQPYYGTFIPDISLRPEVKVIAVPFDDVDPISLDAVAKYEKAILRSQSRGVPIKGLVLCHPHNPLGRCYPKEALVGLIKLCQKYAIHLISDEIYALSVWENRVDTTPASVPFESCSSIDPTDLIDPARLHIVWGMSKDFGANGLRLGAIISQNNTHLHAALIPAAIYSSTSSLSDHISANIFEDESWTDSYIAENCRRLAGSYEIAVAWANENNIQYMPGVNAAFFLWVNLGKVYRVRHPEEQPDNGLDEQIMQSMLSRKVFLASGQVFGSEKPGWFRIVFSQRADALKEGLRRVLLTLTS